MSDRNRDFCANFDFKYTGLSEGIPMNSKVKTIGSVLLLAVLLLSILTVGSASARGRHRDNAIESAGTTSPTTVLYQGYVTVGSAPYDGIGYFKFAIVNAAGNTTYWSNNGMSSGGGQPTSSVSLQVERGYFTVLLGDTSLSGMTQALTSSVFSEPGRYLRVWFATSASGPFTQLSLVPIAAAPYALNAETLDGYDSDAFAVSDHDHWGANWSGSGTGLWLESSAGTAFAAHSYNTSPVGTTIYGENHSTGSNAGFGVEGYSADGIGTVGESNMGTGLAGVASYGLIDQTLRDTVVGQRAGVYGYSAGSGAGGYFASTDGHGVYGTSYDLDGVCGVSTGGNMADNGVYGETNSTSSDEAGVYGYSSDTARGVIGISDLGEGVYGRTNYTATDVAGVRGWSQYGYGVQGQPWDGWAAVYGRAANGRGGYFWSYYGGIGVYGESAWGYGGYISNTLYVNGDIIATGSKSGYVVDVARNADEVALRPGDVVAVVGVSEAILGEIPVMEVQRAMSAMPTAVVGVVDQVFVHDGEPKVVSSACVQQQERIEREMQSMAMAQLQSDKTDPTAPDRLGIPPLPHNCSAVEGFFAADSIQPGDYVSIVTMGVYKAIKVDASYGAIQAGDLLVASANPGYAMKATNPQPGTIIGKALASWVSGTGVIPVFVTLQ
jgi:hypothetical protein